eukprot:8161556-Alexandrium_andersonii.AAC.1
MGSNAFAGALVSGGTARTSELILNPVTERAVWRFHGAFRVSLGASLKDLLVPAWGRFRGIQVPKRRGH